MKKILLALIFLMVSRLGVAQQFMLHPADALQTIFPDATLMNETKTFSPEAKKGLEKQSKSKLKDTVTFTIAKKGEKIIGYGMIDNVLGKTEPITFLTAINPDGTVKEVEILAYREAYGGNVKEKKFLNQYSQKKHSDTLQIGKDIKHVSGATISSRSVTIGVKRDLLIWNYWYGKK